MALLVLALAHGQGTSSGRSGETIIIGGEAAEMSGDGVKVIPINGTPVVVRDALNGKKTKLGHQ